MEFASIVLRVRGDAGQFEYSGLDRGSRGHLTGARANNAVEPYQDLLRVRRRAHGRVRRELGDLFPSRVRFVSISIDPEFDTPHELARFAKEHRAESPGWLFLTGTKEHVKAVVSRLGQWGDDPGDHSTLFIAGNARERHWTKIRPDAPAEAFALQVRKLVGDGSFPFVAGPALEQER